MIEDCTGSLTGAMAAGQPGSRYHPDSPASLEAGLDSTAGAPGQGTMRSVPVARQQARPVSGATGSIYFARGRFGELLRGDIRLACSRGLHRPPLAVLQ